MSEIPRLAGGQSPQTTDYKLYIVCQKQTGPLVLNPRLSSYKNLLEKVKERARLHDPECIPAQKRLRDCTQDTLQRDKAVWHRGCYSNMTNAVQMARARNRQQASTSTGSYTPKLRGRRSRSADDAGLVTGSDGPFTRSSTQPLSKNLCFFCQEHCDMQLFNVRTANAGQSLKKAVNASSDPELKTRYSTCIADGDAHAMDLKYHKGCWTKHVFHVLRDETREAPKFKQTITQVSSFVELLYIIDYQTKEGAYLSIHDVENTYIGMLGGADALKTHSPAFSRQWLKDKILSELPHVKAVRQKNMRSLAVLHCPEACEGGMVHTAITSTDDDTDKMKTLYKSALFIRQRIEEFNKSREHCQGSIKVTSTLDDVPVELYSMIRWVMVGPAEELETKVRTTIVDQAALTLSQNVMFGFKSKRQVTYKPGDEGVGFRSRQDTENPHAVGLALTVHHDTRNKQLLDLLNAQGYCMSYSRALIMETALANAVVENTKQFQGLYVPPFLKKGTFVFFAADNADFAEDTADGKGTTHGTVTAVYQKADAPGEPITPPLCIDVNKSKSLLVTPYHTPVQQCRKPKPTASRNQEFCVSRSGVAESYRLTQLGWVVTSTLSRMKDAVATQIPGWAGYNSLLLASKPLTEVGTLPLLPEVAHEWSTLLTVVKQAIELKELAVGDNHITLITFDMALYEKVIQLVDARPDLKSKVMPRLGELHVVMCAMRALGSSIENSGIDDAWMEADVYGSATTRQILKCTHYKRSLRAHIYSYMALYELAIEQFFKDNPDLVEVCQEVSDKIEDACAVANQDTRRDSVQQANVYLLHTLAQKDVMKRLQDWEAQKAHNAMFRSLMNYLHRVETILYFVAASRNTDLNLHLQAGEALSKLFFAMDRLKYKRLWPRYMHYENRESDDDSDG